jgi:hypothetical protein
MHNTATEAVAQARGDYTAQEFFSALRADHPNAPIIFRLLAPKGAAKDDPRWFPKEYQEERGMPGIAESFPDDLMTLARNDQPRADELGVYFVVNIGGKNKASITDFCAAFAENDTATIEEQHRMLDASPLPTSARIETAKSVHAYWFLEPGATKEQWEELQERLIARFNGDKAIKNADRIMRVPGFDHTRLDADGVTIIRKPVVCVQLEPQRRYTAAEILQAFPAVPEAKTDANGVPNQGCKSRSKLPIEKLREGERNSFITSRAGRYAWEGYGADGILARIRLDYEEFCKGEPDEGELEELAERFAKTYTPGEGIGTLARSVAETAAAEPLSFENFGGSLREVEEHVDEEPNYVIHGLERGEVGATAAATNVGKSTLTRNIVIARACGREYLEPLVLKRAPGKVLYFNFEGGRRRFYREISKMCAVLKPEERKLVENNLKFVLHDKHKFCGQPLNFNNEAHRAFAVGLIKHYAAELVVIDTITTAFTFASENDNAEWQKWTRKLEEIAIESGAAIVFVHHEGKRSESGGNQGASDRNRAHRMRGGSASAQIAQLVINLEDRVLNGQEFVVLGFSKLKDEKENDISIEHTSSRWFKRNNILEPGADELKLLLDKLPNDRGITRKELEEVTGLSTGRQKYVEG